MGDNNEDSNNNNEEENSTKLSSGFTIVLQLVPFLVVACVHTVVVVAQLLSYSDGLGVWASSVRRPSRFN